MDTPQVSGMLQDSGGYKCVLSSEAVLLNYDTSASAGLADSVPLDDTGDGYKGTGLCFSVLVQINRFPLNDFYVIPLC